MGFNEDAIKVKEGVRIWGEDPPTLRARHHTWQGKACCKLLTPHGSTTADNKALAFCRSYGVEVCLHCLLSKTKIEGVEASSLALKATTRAGWSGYHTFNHILQQKQSFLVTRLRILCRLINGMLIFLAKMCKFTSDQERIDRCG